METASANLIEELNKIFEIYTNELREWRLGNGKGKHLLDEDMFDVVIKLLDKSDKIKKLNQADEGADGEKMEGAKVRNIQDIILNGTKK